MSMTGFERPHLQQIIDRMITDVNASLPDVDARLRYSMLNAIVQAMSGAVHEMWAFLSWASDQTNVLYADAENLDDHGEIWGVDRKPASKASGTATFTGVNGSVIPEGTQVQISTGLQYTVTAEATIASGAAVVAIEANAYGQESNVDIGTTFSLVSPVAGVDSAATCISMTGGQDIEPDSLYRNRILEMIRVAPHGGNVKDYEDWALQVPGVTRAFCSPLESGAGTVAVRFLMDGTYEDGIPEAGDVATVDAYIQARRPITANVTVVAPVATPLDITIDNLTPNNSTVRAAIEAELADMLHRKSKPGGLIFLSDLWMAVAAADGIGSFAVTSPSADVAVDIGHIATPGTVTYT